LDLLLLSIRDREVELFDRGDEGIYSHRELPTIEHVGETIPVLDRNPGTELVDEDGNLFVKLDLIHVTNLFTGRSYQSSGRLYFTGGITPLERNLCLIAASETPSWRDKDRYESSPIRFSNHSSSGQSIFGARPW
jgi:hypothetical protein